MSENITHNSMLELAESIARQYHLNQPYGDHIEKGDYFKFHIDPVRKEAMRIAREFNYPLIEVELAALLHDLLEDTDYDELKLRSEFGNLVYEAVKLLTLTGDMEMESYLAEISGNEIAKAVKTADRIVNVSQLKDIKDAGVRNKRFTKYLRHFYLFEKYNIHPDKVAEAFIRISFNS
ncbi:MAG: hypothetical protein ACM3Q2_06845 [Syntrophothermus sp.]